MLFPQVPLMENEGFEGSVEEPQSHLSWFLACSAEILALVWAGLPLAAVLWGQEEGPKVSFACASKL